MMHRIVPIILVLLSASLGFLYIYPTYNGTIASAQTKIAEYDSALVAAASFNKKETELISKRNAISITDLARLQTYLPDGVDNIQLVVDMDALAARAGVTLSGFSIQNNVVAATAPNTSSPSVSNGNTTASNSNPNPNSSKGSLRSSGQMNSLDLSVTATGTYSAFQTFLAYVEQSARPLDITKLTLKDSNTGVYTYTMTFRIYSLQ